MYHKYFNRELKYGCIVLVVCLIPIYIGINVFLCDPMLEENMKLMYNYMSATLAMIITTAMVFIVHNDNIYTKSYMYFPPPPAAHRITEILSYKLLGPTSYKKYMKPDPLSDWFNEMNKPKKNEIEQRTNFMICLILLTKEYIFNLTCEMQNHKYFMNFIILIYSIIFGVKYFSRHKIRDIKFKLIKIDYLDYERERLIFIDNNKQLYFYDTDFGEEFEIGNMYYIKSSNINKRKTKIEYNREIVKAIEVKGIRNEIISEKLLTKQKK